MASARGVLAPAVLAELASRLGLSPTPRLGQQWVGATSTVVRWGDDLTVKVPRGDAGAVRACLVHARVSTAARLLGVRAPEVVAVVDLDPMVRVPLLVSRFLRGHRLSDTSTPSTWASVGAELRILHTAVAAQMPPGLRSFTQSVEVDPRSVVERLQSRGRLGAAAAARLVQQADQLAGYAIPDDRPVLCHGDLHAGNVIVSDGRCAGLVDFSGAGWLDAAWDFVGVPVAAVLPMLEGYRSPRGPDGLLERVAWCRLQTAVHRLVGAVETEAAVSRTLVEARTLLS